MGFEIFWEIVETKRNKDWEKYLTSVRKSGSSCGALVEIVVKGVPAGIGEPIYGKLDAELASALMGINAVKGVEIGSGFKVVSMSGETNSDEISINKKGTVKFLSNNAGGILGGISSGQDILCKLAVKPTSSILAYQKTIDINNSNTKIRTKGSLPAGNMFNSLFDKLNVVVRSAVGSLYYIIFTLIVINYTRR